MKTETCLEIQAYVDGELDARRRATVENLCATDPEARQFSEGLTALRDTLRANEPEFQVPEAREYYWGQIQRRMAAQEPRSRTTSHSFPVWTSWIRWLAPLAGVAALVALITFPEARNPGATTFASMSSPATSSVVYRSDSDGVTVHWIN